jgi:purine-binding chemotaxis protein CheW
MDEASQAITLDSSEIKETPEIIRGNDGDYIDGVCRLKDSILLLINLEKVLSHSQIEELKKMEVDL